MVILILEVVDSQGGFKRVVFVRGVSRPSTVDIMFGFSGVGVDVTHIPLCWSIGTWGRTTTNQTKK